MGDESIENPILQHFEVETQTKLKFEILKKERIEKSFLKTSRWASSVTKFKLCDTY